MSKVLKRKSYDVALVTDDGITQHRIETRPADQMVAESKGARIGVQLEDRLRFTALTIYCALGRLGLYAGTFQEFVDDDLYEWEPVAEEGEAVDPTHSADSTPSASSSPATSEADPPTGSTPTSTSN